MTDTWTQRWNERFSAEEFAYGEEPNLYLKEQLEKLPTGKILFGGEGEGRNAVFAARLGWDVSAFDISVEGKKKAQKLAEKNKVTLDYRVGELETLQFQSEEFDAVALIYAHFQAENKSFYPKHSMYTYEKAALLSLKHSARSTLNIFLRMKKSVDQETYNRYSQLTKSNPTLQIMKSLS